jgi:preprotein translocase subunit SecA
LDLTMGQAIADLIGHELATIVGETPTRVFNLQSAVEDRAGRLDARERELDERDNQLRSTEALLREREARLRQRSAAIPGAPSAVRVGRNEACPCGSGLKYKRCHGRPT